MKVGVIAGSVLSFDLMGEEVPNTDFGKASSPLFSQNVEGGSIIVLARHGSPAKVPPHKVNHRANVLSLADAGARCIVSICSSGALKEGIPVPSIAVPEDYFDLWSGTTIFDEGIQHITPGLDRELRKAILKALRESGADPIDGGTYVQTRGPRLETRSEIRFLSTVGDYVGMNMGSEATIACELGIPVAGIVTIDNPAHGISDHRPDFQRILQGARSNWERLSSALSLIPSLYDTTI
jgi:5'-methylthioadenosine phosphorylase